MDSKILIRVKTAMLLERQAYHHQGRSAASERRHAWQLRIKAAENDQRAYQLFLEHENAGTAIIDSRPLSEEDKFLTHRVRVSSQRLIQTNQCHNLDLQLATALTGLSLVAASKPNLFFGSERMCATYGRIFDELRQLNPDAAKRCLIAFDEQCLELTQKRIKRDELRSWIGDERNRIKGRPMQLIGLHR